LRGYQVIIDVEHHLETQESWKKTGGKSGEMAFARDANGIIVRYLDDASWDIELHLKNMDAAGIDKPSLTHAFGGNHKL
jgi:hypothetical protein